MTTFPYPSGFCMHGKRLRIHGEGEDCDDCVRELAMAEVEDRLSQRRVQGPYRSDGMPWPEPLR
jgi:hypothetical protein